MKRTPLLLLILTCLVATSANALALSTPPPNHFVAGVDGNGKLGVAYDTMPIPLELPNSVNAFFPGWFSKQMGLLQVIQGDSNNGLNPLALGHSTELEIISLDLGLKIYDPVFNPLTAGNTMPLWSGLATDYAPGSANQHTHPWMHIDSTVLPGYDGSSPLSATFRFIDVGTTGYSSSDPFTATFVPEPATIGLLGLGAMTALRRRRQ